MTIRTILVGASGGTASNGAIELGCQLAIRFGARLEGSHVRPDPAQLMMARGVGGFGMPVASGWIDQMMVDGEAMAAKTRIAFTEAVARYGLPLGEQPSQSRPSANWRVETGFAPLLLPRQARFFDLVVLGRSDRVVDLPHTDTIEETLIHSGRPVLLAPAELPATIATTIAVGWNGSPQAVRVVAASLQLLATARTVIIVTIGTKHEESATRLREYLGWHGIATEIHYGHEIAGMGAGQLFLSKARDEDADLLVMGGYGHAPWREALFGGATRELVGTSLLPLLISH